MGAEIGAKIGAEMGAAEGLFTGILILSVIILSINMIFCLLRAVLGPRFSDRLIAINMIGTKTVLMIALLIKCSMRIIWWISVLYMPLSASCPLWF